MKIIENYNGISDTICVDTEIDGPIISIFAGVHWNEISGVKALSNFYEMIKNRKIDLKKWKLIFVLKANQQAIKINKREIKYNLNRLFKKDIDGNDYEILRAKKLMNILDEVDYHLDLHSTSWKSVPFIFSEIQNKNLVKKLWVSPVVFGRNELSKVLLWDTETYMNSMWKQWFTFESWNHDNLEGKKNALQMIYNFLVVLEIIDFKYFKNIGNNKKFIKLDKIYIAKTDNFTYQINPKNFMNLRKDTIIWLDEWEKVIAPYDMILTMPVLEKIVKKWIEVFLIWKQIDI